jgi:hypothetical protein
MYYIGLDVHKKPISYCMKGCRRAGVSNKARFPRLAHSWIETLPQRWTVATTIFTVWVYDHLLPRAGQVKVAHPVMLRGIAAAKKKNDRIDIGKLAVKENGAVN